MQNSEPNYKDVRLYEDMQYELPGHHCHHQICRPGVEQTETGLERNRTAKDHTMGFGQKFK